MYPQRAYRNPLDQLVSFLDEKHGDRWAIWEFRAEGTGYPDEAVYGRIRHYPFPDHHPPPFRLIPLIMASMRNWLRGGDLEVEEAHHETGRHRFSVTSEPELHGASGSGSGGRVAVVHCKAGKGRSGTASCSYLIAEEGWTMKDALERFTQRRMRPQFGLGVSIPSQLRWISYVDRWARGGKRYIDRPLEIVEIQVWGLRNGVRLDVEGFEDEGKRIRRFHTFSRGERVIIEGDPPHGGSIVDIMWDLAGYPANSTSDNDNDGGTKGERVKGVEEQTGRGLGQKVHAAKANPSNIARKASSASARKVGEIKNKMDPGTSTPASSSHSSEDEEEPGGKAVVFRPQNPICIPGSDVNIKVERRNRTRKSMGLNMVTAVGHVWFNAFFEGRGPEQGNNPDTSGVFTIDWDAMDGIKGMRRKGSRALDRISAVWRVVQSAPGEEVSEPAEGAPVPETEPADWKRGGPRRDRSGDSDGQESDGESIAGVKTSGPTGEKLFEADGDGPDKAEQMDTTGGKTGVTTDGHGVQDAAK